MTYANTLSVPDAHGKFGPYGGQFVPETLMPALEALITAYDEARQDPAFVAEFEQLLHSYVGRPSPISHAKRLSQQLDGAQIYLKRRPVCTRNIDARAGSADHRLRRGPAGPGLCGRI
jgi:tryptophan synthase beta chain